MIKKFHKTMLNNRHFHTRKKCGHASYPLHWHEYFEITFYNNYNGIYNANGENYKIDGCCAFIATPMDFHEIKVTDDPNSYSIVLGFSESIIDPALLTLGILPCALYNVPPFLVDAFEEIVSLDNGNDQNALVKIRLLINYALSEFISNGTPLLQSDSYLHPAINKAISYTLKNFSTNISLADVAELCGMSNAYFSDLFHRTMGKTFKTWLTDIRIEYAKRLIENGETSVLNISLDCGYNSLSHFIKVFKSKTGLTPKEYCENCSKI